jgi:hypothetical protein
MVKLEWDVVPALGDAEAKHDLMPLHAELRGSGGGASYSRGRLAASMRLVEAGTKQQAIAFAHTKLDSLLDSLALDWSGREPAWRNAWLELPA